MRKVAPLDPLASVVQRLGILLAAGVTPAAGWGYLQSPVDGVAQVAEAAARGQPVAEAILARASAVGSAHGSSHDDPWHELAAAWMVATDAGAPLASTLAELADSLRSRAQNRRDLQTALAAPVATARMVMVLPIVGILFGMALGFDSIGTLFLTPPGWICLAVGGGLMLLARWWNRRLIARAQPPSATPGLGLDLMAIAVSGGASIPRAQRAVANARERCGLVSDGSDSAISEVLALSHRAGIPAAALLRTEAVEARRLARSDGERKAATLAVTLMLPLGLCVLPAFMVLGVAPLLISVISSTVTSL